VVVVLKGLCGNMQCRWGGPLSAIHWAVVWVCLNITGDAEERCSQKYTVSPMSAPVKEAWRRKHDIILEHCAIRSIPGKGRGIVTLSSLPPGRVVASVPMAMLLNVEHALADAELGPILVQNEWVNDMFALALLLCKIRGRQESKWFEYVQALPHSIQHQWSSRDEFQNSALLEELQRRETYRQQVYADVKGLREPVFDGLAAEDLEWAVAMVQSRLHGVQVRGPDKEWHKAFCLVPVVEYLNTAPPEDINVECFTNERSTHFICATTKHVLAGVELLVKYSPGHISQGRMLLDYGFTLEKNLSEVASAFEREQTKLS